MKTKILKLILIMILAFNFSIIRGQSVNDAQIIGVVNIGNFDFATIVDNNTNKIYKTSAYNINILYPQQNVQLDFNDLSLIKVIHNSSDVIIAFEIINDSTPSIQVYNSNNPYDFMGVHHNNIVKYCYEQGFENENYIIRRHNLQQLTLQYRIENKALVDSLGQYADSQITGKDNVRNPNEFGSTNSTELEKMLFIQNKIELFVDQSIDNKQQIINEIIEFENEILQDDNLTKLEKKNILSASSVYKHSALYWQLEHNTGASYRMKPSSEVMAVDAAGILLSWWMGPIGSAIYCATLSILQNEGYGEH